MQNIQEYADNLLKCKILQEYADNLLKCKQGQMVREMGSRPGLRGRVGLTKGQKFIFIIFIVVLCYCVKTKAKNVQG